MPSLSDPQLLDLCRKEGLDPETVVRHRQRLGEARKRGRKPEFEVIDTCRPDNGGIHRGEAPGMSDTEHGGFCAFILAAGAASRYFRPMQELADALRAEDLAAATAAAKELAGEGAAHWPLPPTLMRFVSAPESITAAEFGPALEELGRPKALQPCVTGGESFFDLKLAEHARTPGITAQVYVVPPGWRGRFAEVTSKAKPPVEFLEQGPALSTVRFGEDEEPVMEDGRLSMVPAGHGALARLFPEVGRLSPNCHSLIVRNIDNVNGISAEATRATTRLMGFHQSLLEMMTRAREALAAGGPALDEPGKIHEEIGAWLEGLPPPYRSEWLVPDGVPEGQRFFWDLLSRLFHTPPEPAGGLARLRQLYERPVNTLGQVPNSGKDVGGTPCFVKTGGGVLKVCLEVPHASPADKEKFLADPAKATHFNPGFVCAEITRDPNYYEKLSGDFWMMAEKTFEGRPVRYHELVLYELLGHAGLANCVFVEIPRLLFHPHKTVADGAGKTLSDWA